MLESPNSRFARIDAVEGAIAECRGSAVIHLVTRCPIVDRQRPDRPSARPFPSRARRTADRAMRREKKRLIGVWK